MNWIEEFEEYLENTDKDILIAKWNESMHDCNKENSKPQFLITDKENSIYIQATSKENAYNDYNVALKLKNDKIPVKRGCKNTHCYCTGDCQEIIGYRDKLPNEL